MYPNQEEYGLPRRYAPRNDSGRQYPNAFVDGISFGGPKDVRYLRSARNALSGGTAASTRQDLRLDHAMGGGKLL